MEAAAALCPFVGLEPPRPERAILPSMLGRFEQDGWIAQYKKNGTYSMIYVSPDKVVTAETRHGEPHKAWDWTKGSRRIFESLPGKGWYVFCAELMHSKGPGVRDTNYVHDVLVFDGEHPLGMTYMQRYKVLQDLFLNGAEGLRPTQSHWVLDEHTWLARNHRANFHSMWNSIRDSKDWQDEGLVLKDPRGRLAIRGNHRFMVKCRRPHENYSF
jgi:hypothetical protein